MTKGSELLDCTLSFLRKATWEGNFRTAVQWCETVPRSDPRVLVLPPVRKFPPV